MLEYPLHQRRPLPLTRTVDLDHDQMLILEGTPRTRVKVIYGGVWLTAEGDPGDHFPRGGDEVALNTRGRAIFQALAKTRLQIIEPARNRLEPLMHALLVRRPRAAHA
jgi:hypothetical protein